MAHRYLPSQLQAAFDKLGDNDEVNLLRAHIEEVERRLVIATSVCRDVNELLGTIDILSQFIEEEDAFQAKVVQEDADERARLEKTGVRFLYLNSINGPTGQVGDPQ